MAEPIGALRAELSANAAQFEKDMGRARKAVRNNTSKMRSAMNGFAKSANNAFKSIVSLRGAAVAAAGAAGLFLLVRRAISAGDEIGKMARAIGITAEQLQEFRFAAGRAGLTTQQLDKAMLKLAKGVGEAKVGTGTMVEIFRKLDPELLKQLKNTSNVNEAFRLMVDATSKMGDELKRAAVLNAAFGRSGQLMASFIAGGVAEMDRLIKKARELGFVIDNETIAKAEKANDELSDMAQIFKIVGLRAALELMPALRSIAKALTDPAVLEGIRSLSTLVARMVILFARYGREILAVAAALVTMSLAMRLTSGVVGKRMRVFLVAAMGIAAGLAVQLMKSATSSESAAEAMSKLNTITKTFGTVTSDSAKKLSEMTKEQEVQIEHLKALIEAWGMGAAAVERIKNGIEIHNAQLANSINLQSKAGQQWLKNAVAIQELNKKLEETKTAQAEATQLIEDFGNAGADAFERVVIGGEKFSEVLSDLGKQLTKILLNKAFTSLVDAAGKNLGPALAKALNSSSTSTLAASSPTGAPGPGANLARGGTFKVPGAGGQDTVPVNFNASPGERVIVGHEGQGSGGGATNIVIDLRGSNGSEELDRKVRQGIAQATPHIVNQSVETVRDGQSRDHNFLR